jgi:hypothetical protein
MAAAFAATLVIGSATFTQSAQAQVMTTQVKSVPKGAVGLGLIGAEIGLVLPAAVGLHETWAFIVFPLVLGAGGAVGGYFAFDDPNSPEGGVAMLAVGMALIIPSVVLTLALTSYDPGDEADGGGEDDELDEEFGGSGGAESPPPEDSARRDARERAVAGAGLLHVGSRQLSLGVPGVTIRPTLTAEEIQRYGGSASAEVNIPVVSGAF